MEQRKPPSAGKPAAKKGTARPASKPGGAAAARKPPSRKPGKSIVNQKQRPWGVIASAAAVLVFAGAVVGIVIATHNSGNSVGGGDCGKNNAPYCQPELAAAKQMPGVKYHVEPNHKHVFTTVKYDRTPPTGGNHSQIYADCSGTVYPQPIANENAVHALEHGAVWVTYKQGLPASQVTTLAQDVKGQDHVFMSPYPDLKSTVSLQAWGYQLFVNKVTDARIGQFISTLKANPDITPETDPQSGAAISCAYPAFESNPSTFGHPLLAPPSGASGGNMSTSP